MYQFSASSSSSSDDDYGDIGDVNDNATHERFKNVRQLLIKSQESRQDLDKNYAYKQKLGDLIFDADFEAANLGHVEQIDQFEYDLMVRPDLTNPRHRIWFNFCVSNHRPNQCVVFNFVNLSENWNLFDEGLTPVVRSRVHPNWTRLRCSQVFQHRSVAHNNRKILSISFRFSPFENDQHQFATFYPYSITNLMNFINRWTIQLERIKISESISKQTRKLNCPESAKLSYKTTRRNDVACATHVTTLRKMTKKENSTGDILKVTHLTESILFKPIYELNIKSYSNQDKPTTIILGRLFGNVESVCSFVCQGLVDFLLSCNEVALACRNCLNWIVFPMLDPDSIWAGNGRTDLAGQALISAKLIAANSKLYDNYKKLVDRIKSIVNRVSHHCRLSIVEFRVNVDLVGVRIVGQLFEDSFRMDKHLRLARLLSKFSNTFYLEKCEYHKKVGANNKLQLNLEGTNQFVDYYQLEISPFGYHKRSLLEKEYEEFDQQKYLLLGKSLAYSLLEFHNPKNRDIPNDIANHLTSFYPSAKDIDDLTLN